MHEREQKSDAPHGNDKLWGVGITNTNPKTMRWVAESPEGRESQRDMTVRTDGGRLEVSQHADTMREEGPEEHHELQQNPKLKLQLILQPKQQSARKSKSAPTTARQWETVPPQRRVMRHPSATAQAQAMTLPRRLDWTLQRDAW